jgi:hypothetical protein
MSCVTVSFQEERNERRDTQPIESMLLLSFVIDHFLQSYFGIVHLLLSDCTVLSDLADCMLKNKYSSLNHLVMVYLLSTSVLIEYLDT